MTDPESPPRGARGRFQVGLRVVFWLTAAIAVWITVWINRRENERLSTRIETLRTIAHDLIIDDPSKIAAVKLDELWNDEQRWDIYLPPGLEYQAHIATREIDEKGLPQPTSTARIAPGRHRLGLTIESGARIKVTVDGASLFVWDEDKDWAADGWTGNNSISRSEQRPADQIVEFHRRRMYDNKLGQSVRPSGPSNGLLLWIEPIVKKIPPQSK